MQIDEANIPGNPSDGPLAAAAINRVLDAWPVTKAVHFCFGNYGGQTIQSGTWEALIAFLNALHADHLVLELVHRPKSDPTRFASCARESASSAWWTSRSITSKRPKRSPWLSSAPNRRWPGPRALRAPGLRFLDVEAVGRGSEDRGAGQGQDRYLGRRVGRVPKTNPQQHGGAGRS